MIKKQNTGNGGEMILQELPGLSKENNVLMESKWIFISHFDSFLGCMTGFIDEVKFSTDLPVNGNKYPTYERKKDGRKLS